MCIIVGRKYEEGRDWVKRWSVHTISKCYILLIYLSHTHLIYLSHILLIYFSHTHLIYRHLSASNVHQHIRCYRGHIIYAHHQVPPLLVTIIYWPSPSDIYLYTPTGAPLTLSNNMYLPSNMYTSSALLSSSRLLLFYPFSIRFLLHALYLPHLFYLPHLIYLPLDFSTPLILYPTFSDFSTPYVLPIPTSIFAPLTSHVICNCMGLPDLGFLTPPPPGALRINNYFNNLFNLCDNNNNKTNSQQRKKKTITQLKNNNDDEDENNDEKNDENNDLNGTGLGLGDVDDNNMMGMSHQGSCGSCCTCIHWSDTRILPHS